MEIKTKIRETIGSDGKRHYIEETYVLSRKIMREKARQKIKAQGKNPHKKEKMPFTNEKLPSLLAVHWREYGSQV